MPDTARAAHILNDRIHPAADRLAQTYNFFTLLLKLVLAENWTAVFDGFNEKEPFVDPDHPNDPRTPITPEDIKAIIVAMQTFVDFIDNSGFRDLILRAAVNPLQNVSV